jgi:succinate dehydrogenase / fumarate reductase cytochrome b subunit
VSGAATLPVTHGVSGFVWRAVTSSLGAKLVMAATGLIFYGWLVLHLAGNLGVFAGRETENTYAHFLKGNPEILWAQRVVWMVIFPIHILSGIRLAALNKAARPEAYASPRNWRQASWSSRNMIWTGLVVLAFFLFHLVHFTWIGVLNTYFADDHTDAVTGHADVFGMVVHAFQIPWVAGFYLAGVILVGFHLAHGLWSGVQTLGLNGRKWTPFAQKLGLAFAILTAAGFCAIPLAVLSGFIKDTP